MDPTLRIPTVAGSFNKVRCAVPVTGLSLRINRTLTKKSPLRNIFSFLFRRIKRPLLLALNPLPFHDESKRVHP